MTALRPLRPDDRAEVAGLFRDTFVLGGPLVQVEDLDSYERLTLDWYLVHAPERSAVLEEDGRVVAAVLVDTDQRRFERWQRAEAWRHLRLVVPKLVKGRYDPRSHRFHWLRLLDGYEAWREEGPGGVGAHAHFTVARGRRDRLVVRTLLAHVEEEAGAAGHRHWYGQMNVAEGRRVRAMSGHGFRVVHRIPNRTLSWLSGRRVERATVVKPIGSLERART